MAGAKMESSRLARIVESGTTACYGIEWRMSKDGVLVAHELHHPGWRTEYAYKVGFDTLHKAETLRHTFESGEGLVGKVFQAQKVTFVGDLQKLYLQDMRESLLLGADFCYKRAALAKKFDLHSAAFVPTKTGVIEVGSMQTLPDLATLLPLEVIKAIREESQIPAVPSTSIPVPDRCSSFLKGLVEGNPATCFGIHWVVASDGMLVCKEHYNPPWRIAYAQKAGLDGLYTTRVAAFRAELDEDIVGGVYKAQKKLFIPNMQEVILEEGERSAIAFARLFLAQEFDIHSVLFWPFDGGVLEIGSMQEFSDASGLLPTGCLADDEADKCALMDNAPLGIPTTLSAWEASPTPVLEQLLAA